MLSTDQEVCPIDITDNSKDNLTKTLLAINRAYQEVIQEKLEKLRTALALNLSKQNEIGEKISNYNQNLNTNKTEVYKFESELNKVKGNYFKDRFQSEPEDNIDTLRRNKLIYYDYVPQLKSEWTVEYRDKLKQAVVEDSIRIIKTPFTNKIKFLDEKLKKKESSSRKSGELRSVQTLMRECRNQIKKIDSMSEITILENIDTTKIDWLKISNVDLNGNWSANECKLVWINVCDPRINQNKWTQEENSRLIDLAREFNEKNWEHISIKLSTNRSAFLCMKRYHEKTVDRYSKRDWSEEESNKLLELVEIHRHGFFVPYNYLCYLNGTRDRNNVFIHHQKIDPNLNHGRWTAIEDQAFDEAVQYFSARNWQEISEYVGTRTALQCKERYELKFLNPDKYKNWTIHEDKKLLDLVDKYGGQWSKIAACEFPTRTDHSCLFRYTKLMNWKRQNEWFESQPEKIQEFIQFIFKKRKSKNDNHEIEIFTEKGEPVPTTPKFGSGTGFLASIIDKIFEKRELVEEFVDRKREGQLSLTLLAKIGIYTPVVNNLIEKYKKYQTKTLQQNNQLGKKKGRKPKIAQNEVKTESASKNKDLLKLKKSSALIESGRIKRKYTKRVKNIRALISKNDKSNEQSNFAFSINYYLKNKLVVNKKRTVKNKKFISQINKTTLSKETTNKNKEKKISKLKISEIFDIVEANKNVIGDTDKDAASLESIEQLLTSTAGSSVQESKSNKRKLAEKNTLEEPRPKRRYNSRIKNQSQNQTQESSTTTSDIKPKRGRQNRNKEINPICSDSNNFTLKEKSSLLVDVNSINESTKIACFSEYPNEFKYMYSLKKDANFMKNFTIIRCQDTLVGIKPFNRTINDEYFTEPRLKAIENAMKKMSLLR